MKITRRIVCLLLTLVMMLGAVAFAPQAKAEDGPTIFHWVSGSEYGNTTTGVPMGQWAYVCYELYADSEGENMFNDVYDSTYTIEMTIYMPDGSVAYSYTASNEHDFWIAFRSDTLGTYTYEIVFDGDIYGTFYGSYIVYDPDETVVRLAGANRWDTSLKVADEMRYALGVEKFDTMIIASGMNFADALSGSYLASVKNAPILLGWKGDKKYDFINEAIVQYVKMNLAEGGTVYILGSDSAVPSAVDSMLTGYNVRRLAGKDRFETNLLILKEAGVRNGDEILVCTATNFADSLSASATGKPILLVFNEYGQLYGGQPSYLASLKNCTFTIIGGENAVGQSLARELGTYGTVSRLAGSDRFDTSVLVAQKYFSSVDNAVLAYAWNFPDGLCGGPLAAANNCPLILTMDRYETKAVNYMSAKGVDVGVVLGSSELISDGTVRKIFSMASGETIFVK